MKVQIIIGSTRPSRVGAQIADWVMGHLPVVPGVDYELVDLATIKLPLFDEPVMPALNQYKHDHTKAWSQKIATADGYIFLTPEYNAGYPASLKNAIDYLYHEWSDKPVLIISYGIRGGGSASAQLRQVVERLKMRPTKSSPALTVGPDMSDGKGHLKAVNDDFRQYEGEISDAANELVAQLHTKQSQPAQ